MAAIADKRPVARSVRNDPKDGWHPEAPRRTRPAVLVVPIVAPTMPEAHYELGRRVGEAVRRVVARRVASTPRRLLLRQLRGARACRSFLDACAARKSLPDVLRDGLMDYALSLAAWTEAARPARALDRIVLDGTPVTADELTFWLQDDNTGCQTGLYRRSDGGVLFWHAEEDTIGFFDRPRIAAFDVAGRRASAFLYPYLLPGPAFGWSDDEFHAVDSLSTRGPNSSAGMLTSVACWLSWRLGARIDLGQLARALRPFADGCAIHRVARRGSYVVGEKVEIGGRHILRTRLPASPGRHTFQVNLVSDPSSPLAGAERLSARSRTPYENRVARMHRVLDALRAGGDRLEPTGIVHLMASRAGGGYAWANADVKAHCVGIMTEGDFQLHVRGGAARAGDRYSPQWAGTQRGP